MKKYFFITLFAVLLYSCSEEFLENYPNTSLIIEKYYATPEDAEQAITAIYNTNLKDDWWSSWIVSEIASDNCTGGAGTSDGGHYQRYDRGLKHPSADANSEAWETYWGGIYRTNVYLENESLIDWEGNEALQAQYEAEARFLRAYYHFYLSRLFGEIPALDKTLAPDEIPNRTPAEELFTFMLDDLKFASENALSGPYGAMDPSNWGRITKWAAEAMFARVYLYYSGYYNDESCSDYNAADALSYINDVIDNSGHSLVPEFASLWRVPTISELGGNESYAGEVNPEVIWAIRYNSSGNPNTWLARMIGPRSTNIDPYGTGWGGMPVLPTLWNLFNDADKRKTASILSWDDEGLVYDWSSDLINQAQYTGYNVKKMEVVSEGGSPEPTDFQLSWDEDLILIRFADVLLMGAELSLITGDNGTSLSLVNQVRERAFGDATHNLGSVTLDDIMLERRLELAFEGLRYWDILRSCKGDFSKLTSILTYVDDTDGGDLSLSSDTYSKDVDGTRFVETKGLFQIPVGEIDIMDGVIQQNPGY